MLELELIRLAYAELLHRWGMDEERLHVLKLCRSARVSNSKYSYSAKRIAVLNGLDEKAGLGTFPQPPQLVVDDTDNLYEQIWHGAAAIVEVSFRKVKLRAFVAKSEDRTLLVLSVTFSYKVRLLSLDPSSSSR